MDRHIVIAAAMIAVLAVVAVRLRMGAETLAESLTTQRELVESSQDLSYSEPSGIDIDGRKIDGHLPTNNERLVAFLIRQSSLHDDVRLWNEVAGIVEGRGDIELIGYCDTPACSTALSTIDRRRILFTTLQSGPLPAVKSVQKADQQGATLVLIGSQVLRPRHVRWRGESPPTIARSVLE